MASFQSSHLDNANAPRVDIVGNDIYIGYSLPGTLSSEPKWSIKKINKVNPITTTWANGNAAFTNTWDDRASLSYS